jgi:hypothetical protein
VPPEFDLRRLHELQALLDAELPSIVATLLTELTRATEQVREAVASRNWPAAAEAAHADRNSALMLDARVLLDTLDRVELAARAADSEAVATAAAKLQHVWPALRAALQSAAREGR